MTDLLTSNSSLLKCYIKAAKFKSACKNGNTVYSMSTYQIHRQNFQSTQLNVWIKISDLNFLTRLLMTMSRRCFQVCADTQLLQFVSSPDLYANWDTISKHLTPSYTCTYLKVSPGFRHRTYELQVHFNKDVSQSSINSTSKDNKTVDLKMSRSVLVKHKQLEVTSVFCCCNIY